MIMTEKEMDEQIEIQKAEEKFRERLDSGFYRSRSEELKTGVLSQEEFNKLMAALEGQENEDSLEDENKFSEKTLNMLKEKQNKNKYKDSLLNDLKEIVDSFKTEDINKQVYDSLSDKEKDMISELVSDFKKKINSRKNEKDDPLKVGDLVSIKLNDIYVPKINSSAPMDNFRYYYVLTKMDNLDKNGIQNNRTVLRYNGNGLFTEYYSGYTIILDGYDKKFESKYGTNSKLNPSTFMDAFDSFTNGSMNNLYITSYQLLNDNIKEEISNNQGYEEEINTYLEDLVVELEKRLYNSLDNISRSDMEEAYKNDIDNIYFKAIESNFKEYGHYPSKQKIK